MSEDCFVLLRIAVLRGIRPCAEPVEIVRTYLPAHSQRIQYVLPEVVMIFVYAQPWTAPQ